MEITETIPFGLKHGVSKSLLRISSENDENIASVVKIINEAMSTSLIIDEYIPIIEKNIGRGLKLVSLRAVTKNRTRCWEITIEKSCVNYKPKK